ncbi:hypothetical protein [Butyrivibrio sp. AD3002]|uniref:hypothetical protein n=1 Tax=Butyrivibrio sp. AD3002 TaxID=1280670 RepID=UPI000403410B|nr:hypothetical protein [Butyrivibrio sp. AD3002]
MSSLRCPVCKKIISIDEPACPICGCPREFLILVQDSATTQIIESNSRVQSSSEATSINENLFCNQCGSRMKRNFAFCVKCGTPNPFYDESAEETFINKKDISGSWKATYAKADSCSLLVRANNNDTTDFVIQVTTENLGIMLVARCVKESLDEGDKYPYRQGTLYYYDYEKQDIDTSKTKTEQSGYFYFCNGSLLWHYDNFDENEGNIAFENADSSYEHLLNLMPPMDQE